MEIFFELIMHETNFGITRDNRLTVDPGLFHKFHHRTPV